MLLNEGRHARMAHAACMHGSVCTIGTRRHALVQLYVHLYVYVRAVERGYAYVESLGVHAHMHE